ncbi:2-amino-4-hydroxy-6-hydroxymethyldihydropteridine diphosphokinase [Cochlodiniinecator piscidefendens]|uniref:2-amino-4-hydroxy-6- hydroxymethyldihydropteridine diphosphokinase n=1 Tax=Cochlodiniinecator piscidefendens TaxID=2715756 RepID=UPI0014083DE3|nr:2-amino-4-hydroxy-6-hydroxymethyldihydropteridine diphosphokinase [Cochlodiniinecator piscidefendens]
MSQPIEHKTLQSKAIVALGANDILEPDALLARLQKVTKDIESSNVRVMSVSGFYQTPCFPAGAGPDFVNAVMVVETDFSPQELLIYLHSIESDYGRERIIRWGMRPLDLDLIAFDDQILPNLDVFEHWSNLALDDQMVLSPDELILPHPRIQDRAFVLVPMCDVASDWGHPVLGKTAKELCGQLPEADCAEIKSMIGPNIRL